MRNIMSRKNSFISWQTLGVKNVFLFGTRNQNYSCSLSLLFAMSLTFCGKLIAVKI